MRIAKAGSQRRSKSIVNERISCGKDFCRRLNEKTKVHNQTGWVTRRIGSHHVQNLSRKRGNPVIKKLFWLTCSMTHNVWLRMKAPHPNFFFSLHVKGSTISPSPAVAGVSTQVRHVSVVYKTTSREKRNGYLTWFLLTLLGPCPPFFSLKNNMQGKSRWSEKGKKNKKTNKQKRPICLDTRQNFAHNVKAEFTAVALFHKAAEHVCSPETQGITMRFQRDKYCLKYILHSCFALHGRTITVRRRRRRRLGCGGGDND